MTTASIAKRRAVSEPPANTDDRGSVNLTERMVQILRLMAEGRSAEQSAAVLHISVHTVKKTGAEMYARLGVHSQGAAVNAGHQLGFLTTPTVQALSEVVTLLIDGDDDSARDRARQISARMTGNRDV